MDEMRQRNYLANEIDSKELNCSWWCFGPQRILSLILILIFVPFFKLRVDLLSLVLLNNVWIWFVMTSWNDIPVLLVFEPAFLTRTLETFASCKWTWKWAITTSTHITLLVKGAVKSDYVCQLMCTFLFHPKTIQLTCKGGKY